MKKRQASPKACLIIEGEKSNVGSVGIKSVGACRHAGESAVRKVGEPPVHRNPGAEKKAKHVSHSWIFGKSHRFVT